MSPVFNNLQSIWGKDLLSRKTQLLLKYNDNGKEEMSLSL